MASMSYRSYVRLLLLTSVACGLEFCVSAGFVYIPPLLMTSGIEGLEMSLVLSLAPILAIITMPYVAKLGDDNQQRQLRSSKRKKGETNDTLIQGQRVCGGRKPIIITLSVGVIISLIILATYKDISLYGPVNMQGTLSKSLLVLGVFGLDYCSQVCLNPFESLLADLYQGTGWSELSYAVYSSMLALGSCVGYLIVAVDQENAASYLMGSYFGVLPHPETPIFIFLTMLFVMSLFTTMLTVGDTSGIGVNNSITLICKEVDGSNVLLKEISITSPNDDDGYESNNSDHGAESELLILVFDKMEYSKVPVIHSNGHARNDRLMQATNCDEDKLALLTKSKRSMGEDYWKEQTINETCVPLHQTTIYKIVSSCYCNRMCHKPTKLILTYFLRLRSILRYVKVWLHWPIALQKLFWAHLFMWTSLMIHNLFYADFMGRYIYQGDPKFEPGITARIMYDKGIRSASWGLLFHSLTAAFVSPLLERFVISTDRLNMKSIYIISLILFNVSMFVLVIAPTNSFKLCNFVTTLTGVTLAVVNSAPFILLTKYHANKSKYYFDQHQISTHSSPNSAIHSAILEPLQGQLPNGHHKALVVGSDRKRATGQSATSYTRPTGIGTDIAVLDIGYFLSQIIATTLVGQIIKVTPDPRYFMVSALIVSSIGCYMAKHLIASDSDLKRYHSSRR